MNHGLLVKRRVSNCQTSGPGSIPKLAMSKTTLSFQRWSREHKARGQGQEHKKIRGQVQPFRIQTLSRPRSKIKNTGASVLQKKEVSRKFFQTISKNKVLKIFFLAIYKISTIQKVLLSSSQGQGNFRELKASRPSRRTCPSRSKPRI